MEKINNTKNKDELYWMNINEFNINKNWLKYLDIKFKEHLIYGRSEISLEDFKYWNDEWNNNLDNK